MKKLLLFIPVIIIVFVFSCKKDDDKTGPTIEFYEQTGYYYSDSIIYVTDTATYLVELTKGDGDLKELIVQSGSFSNTFSEGVEDGAIVGIDFYTMDQSPGLAQITFILRDANNLEDEISATITFIDSTSSKSAIINRDIILDYNISF